MIWLAMMNFGATALLLYQLRSYASMSRTARVVSWTLLVVNALTGLVLLGTLLAGRP